VKVIIAIALLVTSLNATCAELYDKATGQSLGTLGGNPYDPNSTSNPYGQYGNVYSPDSINNPYGEHGSAYSNSSPNNPYATNAPVIVDDK
jgi:hypothetical protein